MADDFRNIRENLYRAIFGAEQAGSESEEEAAAQSIASIRTLLGTLTARAGKGKDEMVQIMAREIGVAVAAMLQEPLAQLAKHQRLQVTFEFVPKSEKKPKSETKSKPPAKSKVKKASSSPKKAGKRQ